MRLTNAISDGLGHAVVWDGCAVPIAMLKGKVGDSPDCSHRVVAWCSSREIATRISQLWNQAEHSDREAALLRKATQ